MTAISKAWVAIADTAVDPASPVDTVLMTGMRDDLVHLREWVGASYFGGAIQDHNHDGANSAPIAGQVGTMKPWPGLALPGVNWDWCDGGTLPRVANAALFAILVKQAGVTITIAAPGVVNWPAHGLRTNMPVRFFTTGGLPTGITPGTHGGAGAGTEYYVKVVDANNFQIATTPGGASINTTGVQSGVHTGVVAPHGDGDGATTFHKPDRRGRGIIGRDDMGGTAANRVTSGGSGIQGNVPGRSGGAETVTIGTGEMPSHGLHGTAAIGQGPSNPYSTSTTGSANVGGGGAHQNMIPVSVDDWIIQIT